MPPTIKKGAKKSKAQPRPAAAKKSQPKQARTVQSLRRELAEAREQQTATSEILRVIASSPTDLQPVLDAVVESARRLCDAEDAIIHRVDGNMIRRAASSAHLATALMGEETIADRRNLSGRVVLERQTIHVADLQAPELGFYLGPVTAGIRTALGVPLFREGFPIGVIIIRRKEVRPFSEKEIELLKTFADQAVIAIENVRLFQELTESLERQTATSEILGVIASSPTDLQPVLDAVAENAARVCGASDALIYRIDEDVLHLAAHYGPLAWMNESLPRNRGTVTGRAVVDGQTIHIRDLANEPDDEFPVGKALQHRFGQRTVLATPLLREGMPIGAIAIRRMEVHPFSDKQIALLKTFADQAVIAIENVRLFKELQERNRDLTEALEQQTATGEVLRVIASSPTELQPVLDTLLANAVKLSGAKQGHIRQVDGEFLRVVAHYNESPERIVALHSTPLPLNPNIPGA